MRAQLVLSELHLVVRLLEKLVERFRRIPLADQESSNTDTAAVPLVFVEIERFLRRELQRLAKETTDMLRTL